MEDKALKQLVLDELDWQPSIDAADIGVTVENGIVRVMGHVPTYAQKATVETMVKRLKGVRGYVNDLEIRPFPKRYSDEAIATQAANALDWDVTLPKNALKVKVENGFVTLTGEVKWGYQRVAAEQAVRRLQGVMGVSNLIALKAQAQAPDIKRRIEDALERQADLEAAKISVTVDGNKVKLEGKVRAWFERDIVESAAWAAPGVQTVEDRVTVGV